MNKHFMIAVVTSSFLTACGGGGGGGEESDQIIPPSASPLTGAFIDSPVKGLRFETPTQSGLTNELGEFIYLAGETVTFYVGGTLLGVALGDDVISPFSLLGIQPLSTEFSISSALAGNEVNSFDRAINIATLLQTLDIDDNPENGIDLGTSHADLANLEISINIKARHFENQESISKAKALTGITNVRSYGDAAQHIYQSLGISVESNLASSFTSKQNDEQLESVNYEYNPEGQLTTENTDSNSDGATDITKTYSYDDNGNLAQITNSATETVETLTYDTNNNILTRLIDTPHGNDSNESYLYTDNKLERFSLDQNADGSVEVSTEYFYNSQGDITRYEVDRDGDGVVDSVSSYSYLNNSLLSYSEDNDNDLIPNILIAYTYDENGNRTSQNVDLSVEGVPNTIATFTYDKNNNAIRYEQDKDLDGLPNYIETYTYDKNNNRTSYKRDIDANGTWDVFTQYFYDRNGNRIKMLEDNDGNGIVDKIWTGDYQPAILDNSWDAILGKL